MDCPPHVYKSKLFHSNINIIYSSLYTALPRICVTCTFCPVSISAPRSNHLRLNAVNVFYVVTFYLISTPISTLPPSIPSLYHLNIVRHERVTFQRGEKCTMTLYDLCGTRVDVKDGSGSAHDKTLFTTLQRCRIASSIIILIHGHHQSKPGDVRTLLDHAEASISILTA